MIRIPNERQTYARMLSRYRMGWPVEDYPTLRAWCDRRSDWFWGKVRLAWFIVRNPSIVPVLLKAYVL